MKNLLLVALFLGLAGVAFADVQGFVRDYTVKEGTLYLMCQFYYDGKILTTGSDGDYDYIAILPNAVKNMDDLQVKDYIQSLIKRKCEILILEHYNKTLKNPYPQQEVDISNSLILKQNLDKITEQIKSISYSKLFIEVLVDKDYDNIYDTKVMVTSGGIKTEEVLSEGIPTS